MRFFESYIGMFLAQSVLHSVIILIIVEASFHSFSIKDHLTKFRYRLLVLILPIISFPLYQVINPERGSMYFRANDAIFNVNKWLAIRILDVFPLYALFFTGLLITALIFFFQEIMPIVREKLPKPDSDPGPGISSSAEIDSIVDNLCTRLRIKKPLVEIVSESYPLLFTTGTKSHAIVVSTGLIEKLDHDQIESALMHELVHTMRGSNIKTQVVYILRMLMFYNPVSLVEFRRLVQDDEFICDNIAVSHTKKPDALIGAIRTFYDSPAEIGAHADSAVSKLCSAKDVIESHSHNLLLDERIRQIEENRSGSGSGFGWAIYILTIVVILKINYMVV